MKPPLEKEIQLAICDYLSFKRYFFWRQNTSPIFDKGKFRAMPKYSMVGVPDIILIKDGTVIFIEVKRPGSKQSDSQREFEAQCIREKVKYLVATSLDDIIEAGL